jgi:pimeloyl-ACP methyl ester carboxylesterase
MNRDFIYRGETTYLDELTRRTATNGSFIKLSDGYTHFDLDGVDVGQPVVLIHGFSVPYFIWDPTFHALVSAGFRVLRYDLYGRGFSDRPKINYDLNLFVRQLYELLDCLNFQQVNLIGLSMGGAIASSLTVRFPYIVRQLVLIDPVGVLPVPLNLSYKAAILPGISELILGLVSTEKLIGGLATDFYDLSQFKSIQDQYSKQMQIKGTKRAILSTLRNKMLDGFPKVYEQLGRLNTAILLLWGRSDKTLPIQQSGPLLKLMPNAEFHIIENCGHIPHYERPEIVNPTLVDFLTHK